MSSFTQMHNDYLDPDKHDHPIRSHEEPPTITLECMKDSLDGCKWGPSDWYENVREGIVEALKKGPDYNWTTDWYGCKKEILSACITHENGVITTSVSVSDDFDTEGVGHHEASSRDIYTIELALDIAHNEAKSNRKENACYQGFSVMRKERWLDTYITPRGWGCEMNTPPGDNYHQWGFQDEYEWNSYIHTETKKALSEWAEDNYSGEFTFNSWTIKVWKD